MPGYLPYACDMNLLEMDVLGVIGKAISAPQGTYVDSIS